MLIRYQALAVTFVITLLVIGAKSFDAYQTQTEYDYKELVAEEQIQAVNAMQVSFKDFAASVAATIGSRIVDLSDTQSINKEMSEFFRQSNLSVNQAQIISKDGMSLYRLIDEGNTFQNISLRPLVRKTISTKQAQSGFEAGLSFSGFRYLHPILDQDNAIKFIIELSISEKTIIERMQEITNKQFDLVIVQKDKGRIVTETETSVLGDINFVSAALQKSFDLTFIDNHWFYTLQPIIDSSGELYGYSIMRIPDKAWQSLVTQNRFVLIASCVAIIALTLFAFVLSRLYEKAKKERKLLERESENFSTGPVVVMRWQPTDGWPVEYASPNVASVLGYRPSDFLGQGGDVVFSGLIHPEDRDEVANEVALYTKEGIDTYRQDYRVLHKHGHYIEIADYTTISRNENGSVHLYLGYILDQTMFKANEQDLALATKVFNASREGIIITDKDRRVVYVNDAMMSLSGYSKEESLGKSAGYLKSDKHSPEFYKEMNTTLDEKGFWTGEIINKTKTGEYFQAYTSISSVHDTSGEIVNYFAIFFDVTEKKKAEEALTIMATRDALTGAYNRKAMESVVIDIVEKAEPFCFLFVDMDRFKAVNDTKGHAVGDGLIREFYKRIKIVCDDSLLYYPNEQSVIARQGGDEFLVLLKNMDKEQALAVAHKIIESLSHPFSIEGSHLIPMTSSIGVVAYPEDSQFPDNIVFEEVYLEMVRKSDIAMYFAKDRGRNQVISYESSMGDTLEEDGRINELLRESINASFKGFFMMYQPQYRFNELENKYILSGFEALLRWEHQDAPDVKTPQVISLLENSGCILEVGKFVVEKVINDVSDWQKNGTDLGDIRVSFNISADQLNKQDVVDIVKNALLKHDIDGKYFEMEITESTIIANYESVNDIIRGLHDLGLHVSIDDFGTGHSNLSALMKMKINKIKIDRSLVAGVDVDKTLQSAVKAIISIAASMGAKTIAEGTEHKDEVSMLVNVGNTEFQGYHFSKPLLKEHAEGQLLLVELATSTRPFSLHSLIDD